jgi:sulfur carrier protein ThiS
MTGGQQVSLSDGALLADQPDEPPLMKTIQVFDPPMCCSTGICGPSIDPDLVNFAASLSQLANMGVKIERQNLGQQPMAFAKNAAVKALLEKEGTTVLPVIFIDGEVYLKGRYPNHDERPVFFRTVLGIEEEAKS